MQPLRRGHLDVRADGGLDAGARLSTHLGNGAHAMIHRHHPGLWSQLAETRMELWKREAELATAVPVVQWPRDGEHIANRLQASLKAAVDASAATAAGAR